MHAWAYGEAISPATYVAVCARIFGRRRPSAPAHRVLLALQERAPLRLDFEINRTRGLGFEAGEHGFTVERVQ